jgi:hypothetical protein
MNLMILFLLIESWELVMFNNKIPITAAFILTDMIDSMPRIKLDQNFF